MVQNRWALAACPKPPKKKQNDCEEKWDGFGTGVGCSNPSQESRKAGAFVRTPDSDYRQDGAAPQASIHKLSAIRVSRGIAREAFRPAWDTNTTSLPAGESRSRSES